MDNNGSSDNLDAIKLSEDYIEVGLVADLVSWRIEQSENIAMYKMAVITGNAETCMNFFQSKTPLKRQNLFMCGTSMFINEFTSEVINLIKLNNLKKLFNINFICFAAR